MPRPVDSSLHGVLDYTLAAALLRVDPRQAAVLAGYSTLTDYPLGIVKAIPFKAHLALDAAQAVALAVTPFVTGRGKKGRRQWLPHVALATFELGSLLMTDPTGKGEFHGDVEAVRAANTVDPKQKIYEGPPAVKAASA